jgi:hypothetical protein
MPLLQVWSCLLLGALGRHADELAVVADRRLHWRCSCTGAWQLELDANSALAGALLVASLPLANVTSRWPATADLPMAALLHLRALALLRWTVTRDARRSPDCPLLMALACTQIKNPGSRGR